MHTIKLSNLKNLNPNLVKIAVDAVEKTPLTFTGLVLGSELNGDICSLLDMEKILVEISEDFEVLLNWTMGGINYFCDLTGEFL